MAKATETVAAQTPPTLQIKTAHVVLTGDSPLIMHRWSEKAKGEMRDKHAKKAKGGKEQRNPDAEFEASIYRDENNHHAFPAVAFKACAVDACSFVDGMTKVEARGCFHINGDLVLIHGEPVMREDMVRVGMGSADLRYRAEFKSWRAEFPVRYNARAISLEQLANLFHIGGFAVGVGEWRPQKDGSFGMFHVETIVDQPAVA